MDSPIMVQTTRLTLLASFLLATRVLSMALLYSGQLCQTSTMVERYRHIECSVGLSLCFEPSSCCIYEGLWTLVFIFAFRCLCQELQWYFLFSTNAPTAPSTPHLSCVEENAFPSSVPTLLATVISTVPLSCQRFASNRIATLFCSQQAIHLRHSTPSVPSSEGQSTSDRFQLRWLSTLLFHCLSSTSDSLQELLWFLSFMFDTPSPFMTRQAILQMCQSFLLCFLLLRSITVKRRFQLCWLLLPTLLHFHCHFCGLLPELLRYFRLMSRTPLLVTSGQLLSGEHQFPQSLVPTSLATTNNTSAPLFQQYFLIMGDNSASLSCSSVSGFWGASTSKKWLKLSWLLSRTLQLVFCPFSALLSAPSRFFSFMGDTFLPFLSPLLFVAANQSSVPRISLAATRAAIIALSSQCMSMTLQHQWQCHYSSFLTQVFSLLMRNLLFKGWLVSDYAFLHIVLCSYTICPSERTSNMKCSRLDIDVW